jgi:hypothetical protein
MAGTLSRSMPSPVTGVGATAWNAGIWGAGAGTEGREGAGADTRREGAGRAGAAAGAVRRTGAGRGAVTVTSGKVSVTCPQVPSGNINTLMATACNSLRRRAQSRDLLWLRPPHTPFAPTNIPNQLSDIL